MNETYVEKITGYRYRFERNNGMLPGYLTLVGAEESNKWSTIVLTTDKLKEEFVKVPIDNAFISSGIIPTVSGSITTFPKQSEWTPWDDSYKFTYSDGTSTISTKKENEEEMVTKCECSECDPQLNILDYIENVIYNGNVTTVIWADGTKTIVRPSMGDAFDPEVGLAMAITQELFGSRSQFVKFVTKKINEAGKRKPSRKSVRKEFYVWPDNHLELDSMLESSEKLILANQAKNAAEIFVNKYPIFADAPINVIAKDTVDKKLVKNNYKIDTELFNFILNNKSSFEIPQVEQPF
jgi:hypothetical protein